MPTIYIFQFFIALIACSFALPASGSWEKTTRVSISQQPFTTDDDTGPLLDANPGIVTTEQEGEIGMIKDFILDLQSGRIAYIVGSFDYLENYGNTLFVIPWGIVRVAPEMPIFTLLKNVTLLKNAPRFLSEHWPNLQTREWTATVDAYWQKTNGTTHPSASFSKASELLGLKIKNRDGKDLGTIEQLLMDTETGAISYVILSSENKSKDNQISFFSLPWNSIQVSMKRQASLVDTDSDTDKRKEIPDELGAAVSLHSIGY